MAAGLGEVSSQLTDVFSIISSLLTVACIGVGTWLILNAFAYYKIHRSTPKAVPLWQPIGFFLFGLIVLCIPFLGDIIGGTGDPNPNRYEYAEKRHKELMKKDCKQPGYDKYADDGHDVDYICSDSDSFYD